MRVVIEVRNEWLDEFREAIDIDGCNDDEHDLLVEIADEVAAGMGRFERAESMTDEQLDQELIRTLSEQLRHLRGRFPDEGAAVIALDVALDRWDEFVALTEGGDG